MNKKTVWIIVIVVTLLIIGGLIFYLSSRSRSKTGTATPTTSPQTITQPGRALPLKDSMGTDLEVVSRYPGSVRVKYSKSSDASVTKISYQTKDSTEEVKEYYFDKMTSSGWQMTSSEGSQVVFKKEPARLYLWLDYHETSQITEYELKYFPE